MRVNINHVFRAKLYAVALVRRKLHIGGTYVLTITIYRERNATYCVVYIHMVLSLCM